MRFDPDRHHRRSIRLRNYDYSQAGAYYVTICVHNREHLLSQVDDGNIELSTLGCVVDDIWLSLPERYPALDLDSYVIMPNHMHGILVITGSSESSAYPVGAIHELPPRKPPIPDNLQRRQMLLAKIIGSFKMRSAKTINAVCNTPGCTVWQRNYWEHVIHDDEDLERIRAYIEANPAKWSDDPYYAEGQKDDSKSH